MPRRRNQKRTRQQTKLKPVPQNDDVSSSGTSTSACNTTPQHGIEVAITSPPSELTRSRVDEQSSSVSISSDEIAPAKGGTVVVEDEVDVETVAYIHFKYNYHREPSVPGYTACAILTDMLARLSVEGKRDFEEGDDRQPAYKSQDPALGCGPSDPLMAPDQKHRCFCQISEYGSSVKVTK